MAHSQATAVAFTAEHCQPNQDLIVCGGGLPLGVGIDASDCSGQAAVPRSFGDDRSA